MSGLIDKDGHLIRVQELVENADKKLIAAVSDLAGVLAYWAQSDVGVEVQGDADATGTEICVLEIPDGKTFVCCIMKCSSNIAAMVYIGHGTLASMTNKDFIDIQNVGMGGGISDGNIPFFIWKNDTGAAVEIVMYAPQTANGAATNNDVNHYFHGFIGGLII